MKRAALLFILLFAQLFAQGEKLNSFDELMNALKSGAIVRAIIDYSKCKIIYNEKELPPINAIGGMNFETFEYFGKGALRNDKAYVVSSETVLISHPTYGAVFNYVKVKVLEDSQIEIIARYLDPKSYEIKMDEKILTQIKNELNDGGVTFYKLN